jgi:hypothetical protein
VRLLDHGPEILAGRDVRRHHQRATVKTTYLSRSALRIHPIELGDNDVRTHLRQLERDGATNAAAGAGDYATWPSSSM